MSFRQVQRYNHRRAGRVNYGCLAVFFGLVLVIIVGLLLLIPALPAIGVRLLGFVPVGDTTTVFADVTPIAPVQIEGGFVPVQATINLGEYGSHDLPPTSDAYRLTVDPSGQTATAAITEAGLLQLCGAYCTQGGDQIHNVRIDLRPGGAVVYGDLDIPGVSSQTVGVVMQLTGAARFSVAGVDLDGVLYAVPPEGLGETVREVERIGNTLLQTATLQTDSGVFSLSEVYSDETAVTLVLR